MVCRHYDAMSINELQRLVLLEAGCLVLICTIIVAAFRRWNITVAISTILASIAFFSAWSFAMAMGAFLVFAPAGTLLLIELENKDQEGTIAKLKNFQSLAWSLFAIGVVTIVIKNICNILGYLSN